MPYIDPKKRRILVHTSAESYWPATVGELNYYVTCAVDSYIAENGLNYSTLNAVIGVLECAKLELYRRVVAPYEDQKMKDNGDVYTCTRDQV
jgi:hypothetical protein